ncbi:sigma-70 family RNA polymerase sigma factor [Paenibacillus lutrae]|uniref:sigma-70 family RNA polymerase sigma factor n=1 Tax=Paenibacillus lutrae TaxID=2078573 RepID=UPI0012F8C566
MFSTKWNENGSTGTGIDGGNSLEQLYGALTRYCLSLTRSQWEAEDLAQEAWLKAMQIAEGPGFTNKEALLLRIAKNTWIDQLRRHTVLQRILKQEEAQMALPDSDSLEIESAMQALMIHLSPLQRTVFILRDVFALSITETARQLQTTEGAVKAALHRARQSLASVRDCLLRGELALPQDAGLREYLKVCAGVYLSGNAAALVELMQLDLAEPAVAWGFIQSQSSRKTSQMQRRVSTPQAAFGLAA